LTHYHADHFGGMEELSKRIPIREFIDHGPNVQPGAGADWERDVYPKLCGQAKHTIAKAGNRIALKGVDWRIVSSAGEIISPTTLPGANKPNPECAKFQPFGNNMEDPMSVASYITFGRFHTAHLGDLTRNMEFNLMCPITRLPPVQLFLGLHHGVESSNAEVMVHGLRPRVAIINNGTRKGGDPHTMTSVYTSPGLEDLWQIHFSQLSGQEYTQPGMFIANRLDDDFPNHADCANRNAGARCASRAHSQRQGLLDQSVGQAGRLVHRYQSAQRLFQNLRRCAGKLDA
jgi:hypothetical protein